MKWIFGALSFDRFAELCMVITFGDNIYYHLTKTLLKIC